MATGDSTFNGIVPGEAEETIPESFDELERLEDAFVAGLGSDVPSAEGGEGEVGPSPLDLPDPTADEDAGGPGDGLPPVDEPAFQLADDGGIDLDETPPAEPAAPPADSGVDLNEVLSGYLGRAVQADDARSVLDLMSFAADLQSLPPDAQQAIGQILQTRGVPAQQPAPAPVAPVQQQPAPVDDPWGDPASPAPTADPRIEAELAEMRAWRAQQEASQQQQWQQWVGSEQSAAVNDFVESAPIPLSTEDMIVLERKAMQSGEFVLEMNRTNNSNPRLAWKNTLEKTLWTDPQFRDRVISNEAQQRAAAAQTDQARQQRAASVSAGGGAVPSPSEMESPVDMRQALERAAADVGKLMANGQPPGV